MDDPTNFEKSCVHDFYNSNSTRFADTRYAPWPGITRFLQSLDPKAVILDSGCGNGRNMSANILGLDACFNLLQKAQTRFNKNNQFKNKNFLKLVRGDVICHPFRDSTFDAILSIAVVHHFCTRERRLLVLRDLFRILKSDGSMLIYVWSDHIKMKRKCLQISGGDYFVTFDRTQKRYYFLYDIDGFCLDLKEAGFVVNEICIEQESIKAIVTKK